MGGHLGNPIRINYDQMMGLLIRPWSNLPIEAALLWLAVTFTTAIFYETIINWFISGNSFWEYFFRKELYIPKKPQHVQQEFQR